MRTHHKTCACCGAEFLAAHRRAKWCSSQCRQRAYERRRRGRPEADAHVLDLDDDLPLVWNPPAPAGTEQRFWRGTAIQRRQSDGFVNATAMCQAGGKRWNHYATLDRTREYLAALQADVVPEKRCGAVVAGIPATAPTLIDTVQGGTPSLQGTWIHPRLAVDLARWISPAFAVWMDGWFLEGAQPLPAPQPLPDLVTSLPLPAPRQLLIGEDPHRLADLARGLREEAEELAEPLLDRLQLVATTGGLSPSGQALAEEIHGTIARLQRLACAFALVA